MNLSFLIFSVQSSILREDNLHASSPIQQLCYLIDGQQRLATVSLLLATIGKAIKEESDQIGMNKTDLQNRYLFNSQWA